VVHTSAGRSMPSHARHETAQQSRNYSDAVRLGVSVQGDRHRSRCGGIGFHGRSADSPGFRIFTLVDVAVLLTNCANSSGSASITGKVL